VASLFPGWGYVTPKINLDSLNLVIIQGNSIKGYNIPITPEKRSYRSLNAKNNEFLKGLEKIKRKHPDMADLLICIWKRESSFGKNMIGDKGKAFGHFQIWISKHPVSYKCAMDFECSLNFTAQKIKEGKGQLWTTYKPCLTEISKLKQ